MSDPEISRSLERVQSLQADSKKLRPGVCKDQLLSFLHRVEGVAKLRNVASAQASETWAEVRECFETSAEFLPTNADALFLCGMAALEASELVEAVNMMNKSLLLDPDFPSPYINIGVAYLRCAVLADQCDDAEDAMKNFRRAIEVSEALLERHPQRPQAHYHIGVAYCQIALRLRGTSPHVFEDLRIRAGRSLKEA